MSIGSVKISYEFVDGAHFFTPTDPHNPLTMGLCVASTDIVAAFNEVTNQLNVLAKKNLGKNIQFGPAVSVEGFIKWLDAQRGVELPSLKSMAIADWQSRQGM